MNLTKHRKKKLKRALKKENIKEGKLLRKVNFWKKKRKKQEENTKTEKELWGRLRELNQEFRDIKGFLKNLNCQIQYLRCKYFLL